MINRLCLEYLVDMLVIPVSPSGRRRYTIDVDISGKLSGIHIEKTNSYTQVQFYSCTVFFFLIKFFIACVYLLLRNLKN